MNRREYLRKTSTAVLLSGTTIAAAGCLGGDSNDAPPPRKSNVVEEVSLADNAFEISLVPSDDRWIMSRREINSVGEVRGALRGLSGVSPVGEAAARKGRGATGRGSRNGGFSSAPKTRRGRARFWGGGYTGRWYDDHDDDVERYPAAVSSVCLASFGSNERFQELSPGPGPVNWEERHSQFSNPLRSETRVSQGWYRVGVNVNVPNNGSDDDDLGWESVDVRVEREDGSLEITERWKVSPRI